MENLLDRNYHENDRPVGLAADKNVCAPVAVTPPKAIVSRFVLAAAMALRHFQRHKWFMRLLNSE